VDVPASQRQGNLKLEGPFFTRIRTLLWLAR
jgi:hypothetical protein